MKFRFVAAIHNDGLAEKRRGTLTDNPRQDIRAAARWGGNDDAQRRGSGAREGKARPGALSKAFGNPAGVASGAVIPAFIP